MTKQLRLTPEYASFYAKRLGLQQVRDDFDVASFRTLSALDGNRGAMTYLSSAKFAQALKGETGLTVITSSELQVCVPEGNGVLLTDGDPRNAFYAALESASCAGLFENLETYVSPRARIAASAVVSPNVYVDEDVEIGAGVVILPNTHIGEGVVIKPNAVIGGDGFEATHGKDRHIVKHAGGVWLDDGAQVGSNTCIDKGLFGDFTFVGSRTLIDNLVHFAHSARTGSGCSIIACAEISGSVELGDGVWIGPRVAINQGLRIADHCYIGTGSVVTRDLPAHSLAFGSPAKAVAWVCSCRAKLAFGNDRARCAHCGKQFVMIDDKVTRA